MREIEFRGKSKENGKWYYGHYCKETNNACFKEEYVEKHYIRFQENMDWNLTRQLLEEVSIETVGQYTGLKDKFGNKVFEGDKVMYDYPFTKPDEIGVVTWNEQNASFQIKGHIPSSSMKHLDQMKVIGNIYEENKD